MARQALDRVFPDHGIDVGARTCDLSIAQQQMVEIAKAVSLDAKLIIMDEPTSSLGKEEINQLMETVRGLKAKGVAILFVSHKLEELFELCDRVTVMRDGEHIVTQDIGDMTEDSLINAMVGRTLDNLYPKEFGVKGDVWLEARNLNEAGVLHDVSFKAYGGQITGFAGLVGAGRTETMRAIFGADRLDSGEIYVKGEKVHIRTPKDAIKKKIAFLTEDRKGQGLVLSLDVRTNLILANMKGFSNGPFLNKGKIEKSGQDNVESLRIKTPSLDEVTAQLSGGNQQKVVIGKWVNTDADIFIFDEPTRGIDVAAKVEIYNLMNQLKEQGIAVMFVSSEMPEVMGIAESFPAAYMKTQMAIDYAEPEGGVAFISVNDQDKRAVAFIARELVRLGFSLLATEGTAAVLRASGVPCEVTGKIHEGASSVVDAIAAGEISLMINTPLGVATRDDGYELRRAAVRHGITYATTLAAAQALIAGMQAARAGELDVAPLQEL